jgi:hypothetical protein
VRERGQERARRQYEQMARRLAELDRLDGIDLSSRTSLRPADLRDEPPLLGGGRGPRDHRVARRRDGLGRGTRRTLLAAGLVVALLVVGSGTWRDVLDVGGVPSVVGRPAPGPVPHEDRTAEAVAEGLLWPPLPADASASRLAPAVPATSTGSHAFLELRPDGGPVRYDPCRPLHFVVNPSGMPDGGLRMVREAVDAVSAATGLVFTEGGVVNEPLSEERAPHQPERYGDRWAPILIGWGDASTFPMLSGETVGLAGSDVLAPAGPGSERFVSGQVALDRQDFRDMLALPDGYQHARAVVLHELGHVVGLDHVADPTELMHEENNGQTRFGPGDLEGLAVLGAGPCFRDT